MNDEQTGGNRDASGRFLPGQSGNKGGRSKIPEWMHDRAPKALAWLCDVAEGKAEGDFKAADRVRAAEIVVAYCYNKPVIETEVKFTGVDKFAALLDRPD